MTKITPLIKGAITGILMAAVSYWMVNNQATLDYGVYIIYAIFFGGIAWTLFAYSKSPEYNPSFGSIFGVGFRCFIIITLIMVLYTLIYLKLHPELAEVNAQLVKTAMIEEKNSTPAKIEETYLAAKKGYITSNVYLTIFATLVTGSFFTAAGAGLLLLRKK
jgi:hypothetical protein